MNKAKERHSLCQSVFVGESFVCLLNEQKQYYMYFNTQEPNNGYIECNRKAETFNKSNHSNWYFISVQQSHFT